MSIAFYSWVAPKKSDHERAKRALRPRTGESIPTPADNTLTQVVGTICGDFFGTKGYIFKALSGLVVHELQVEHPQEHMLDDCSASHGLVACKLELQVSYL